MKTTDFPNVEITGMDMDTLDDVQREVLFAQAQYCQAMTDADIDTLRDLTVEDITYTHMSGMQQTREQYFEDVANGNLRYFTIGIESPTITVYGNQATITFTSILNANAYGARGTFRMPGTHHWERLGGRWLLK